MRTLRLLFVSAVGLCTSIPLFAAGPVKSEMNRTPAFIIGDIVETTYDGVGDDLLTGGLGKTGLQSATPPPFADPLAPTPAELRTRAIYNNYRALVDVSPTGGYGTLYGPNIDLTGNPTLGEGKIAGTEFLALARDVGERSNIALMVQIPANFDPARPCIVTAPSSGSRGVYGAIGTVGEWALKRGCAVAYTDKGGGHGVHDLQNNSVNLLQGTRAAAQDAGRNSHFTAPVPDNQRESFNAETPNRFAFKHAHSEVNPEQRWGEHVLNSIEFAFFLLNEKYGTFVGGKRERPITRKNTIVIAASVSNGGGASIAAAEQDHQGLIDAVVVGEPQVQLGARANVTVRRGGAPVPRHSSALIDYFTFANLYQPCAAYAPEIADAPLRASIVEERARNRCAALRQKGLLSGDTFADQATDALRRLRSYGWEADSDFLHASHYGLAATPGVAVAYVNAYGRFSVLDNICGFSYGATDTNGSPIAAPPANVAQLFANGSGVPPTGGINIINNLSANGARLDALSVSPSTGLADLNVDGALCLRDLATNTRTVSGEPLSGGDRGRAQQVEQGIAQVRRHGNLHGKPTIIVHGRGDTLVPVNHSSRPYVALNRQVEGATSRVRYYEVTNAQHFDAFLGIAGFDTRYIPLQYYNIQALNLMYQHLTNGTSLPPSQVIRTTPRGGTAGSAPAITTDNLPPIAASPASANLITVAPGAIDVPD